MFSSDFVTIKNEQAAIFGSRKFFKLSEFISSGFYSDKKCVYLFSQFTKLLLLLFLLFVMFSNFYHFFKIKYKIVWKSLVTPEDTREKKTVP